MADAAAQQAKKREREQVLFELRAKRNQARRLHKDEVMAEAIGEKARRTEGHAEYVAQRAEAEANAAAAVRPVTEGESAVANWGDLSRSRGEVVDKEKEKRMETTGVEMEAMRKRKEKKAKNQGFTWVEHNAESKYRAYKNRVDTLNDLVDVRGDYERQKAAGVEMERDVADLAYGEAPAVPAARLKALSDELELKEQRKSKFRRRKSDFEETDIRYINSKVSDVVERGAPRAAEG